MPSLVTRTSRRKPDASVGNTLRVGPCVPRGWPGFEVAYRHRSASYRIRVENPAGVERGVRSVTVDGQPVSGGSRRFSSNAASSFENTWPRSGARSCAICTTARKGGNAAEHVGQDPRGNDLIRYRKRRFRSCSCAHPTSTRTAALASGHRTPPSRPPLIPANHRGRPHWPPGVGPPLPPPNHRPARPTKRSRLQDRVESLARPR
jgi:hypothetical protein